jgi:hypothetical protein
VGLQIDFPKISWFNMIVAIKTAILVFQFFRRTHLNLGVNRPASLA